MCILSTTSRVSWVNNHLSVKRPPKEGPYFKFLFRLINGHQLLDTRLSLFVFSFFCLSLLCVIFLYLFFWTRWIPTSPFHFPEWTHSDLMLAFSANSLELFWLLRFWVIRYVCQVRMLFWFISKNKTFYKKNS